MIVEIGNQLSKGMKGEEDRCMSAADVVEIFSPQSNFLVTLGDACHRTDYHCAANYCLIRQTGAQGLPSRTEVT